MKVCEACGIEIGGRDGVDVRCQACEEGRRKKENQKQARRDREAVLRSLGLTKVRGNLGGTYWE